MRRTRSNDCSRSTTCPSPIGYRLRLHSRRHSMRSRSSFWVIRSTVSSNSSSPHSSPTPTFSAYSGSRASVRSWPSRSISRSTESNDSPRSSSSSLTAESYLEPTTRPASTATAAARTANRYLKLALSHAAVRAVQYFPEIKHFYQRKARQKNPAIARTLVQKELARSAYIVLKEQIDFNHTFKGQPLSKRKASKWPRRASPDA